MRIGENFTEKVTFELTLENQQSLTDDGRWRMVENILRKGKNARKVHEVYQCEPAMCMNLKL